MSNYKFQKKEIEKNFFSKKSSFDVQPNYVVEKIAQKCTHFLTTKSHILEAGSGIGRIGKMLAQSGHTVSGVDLSRPAIEYSQKNKVENYSCRVGDLEDPDLYPSFSFDLILCPGVLHHFPNLYCSPIVENLVKWCSVGGYIVIWEPNGSSVINKLSNFLSSVLLQEKRFQYSTENEVNHTVATYLDRFKQNDCFLVHGESFSDKASATFNEKIISYLIEARWTLTKVFDRLLPFPYSGAMIFLVFKK